MQKEIDLIVFDWDGTILDSAAAIVNAIQAACHDLGVDKPTDQQARQVIGLGLSDALQSAVPGLPEREYPKMVERYKYHYLSGDHELALFKGIEALLAELANRGFSLAVATGKSRLGLERAFRHSGLGAYFQAFRCADMCHSKPHPQMLEELIQELGSMPERTIMIGDTTHDLLMARNAGTWGIGVSYGAHPRDKLCELQPLACVDTVQELHAWLQQHAQPIT